MERTPFVPSLPGVYDPNIADAIRSQSFGQRAGGLWVPVRETGILLSDNTINDVSTSKHGFAPKLPNDSTKFFNGVGSYSVPDYTAGGADPLGKAFFSHNGFLPGTTFKEDLNDYPATDFANLASGTKSVSMSRVRFTPGGSNSVSNWGHDLGGLKTTVLFILSWLRPKANNTGLFISDTLPTVGQFESGYNWTLNPLSGDIELDKRTGGAYTVLASETKVFPANVFTGPSFGLAIYYNDTTNRLIGFIRTMGEAWVPICDVTDTSLTKIRYVGLSNNGATTADVMWFGVPIGIYYDN